MGTSDGPVEATRTTEVRQMRSPSADKLDQLLKQGTLPSAQPGQTLSNEGQISKMPIPSGWSRNTTNPKLSATANFVEFHSDKTPAAKICTYYRGHKVSPAAGKRFHDLLQQPDHALTKEDFLSLAEVLRDKAKSADFTVANKRTQTLHGKRVLVVEGTFKELKQKTYCVYVDANDTGEVIQEIFYQAPESVYTDYAKAAEAAIQSISWK